MVSARQLRGRLVRSPYNFLSLFANSDVGRWAKCPLQDKQKRKLAQFSGFTLPDIKLLTGITKSEVGFACHSLSFSTMAHNVLVQARDIGRLCEELEDAIDEHKFGDAWHLHEQYIQAAGFPRSSVVNKLLIALTESLDDEWLQKAFGLVELAFEEHKEKFLERNTIIYVALGLARCGQPVPASTIVRKLVEIKEFPPVAALAAILAYMSLTPQGAYLAAELVLEISYLFQDGRVDPRKKSNQPLISMKPTTTVFNIALAGCLLFGTTRKAEQLLDMMPRISVKADATLLIIMAQIYESNGRREELKKLNRHIDDAQSISDVQYWQFHNCLLSCHLKLGDLESASHMVLEMLRKAKRAENSLGAAILKFESTRCSKTETLPLASISSEEPPHLISDEQKNSSALEDHFLSYGDICGDRRFSRLEAEAVKVLDTLIMRLQKQINLITSEHGILRPTEQIYLKLVTAFLEAGRTKDLAEFLIKVEKEDSPVSVDNSMLVHAIRSCISLGWLDQAHDLLDEMRVAGVQTGSSVYTSLLKAYCKGNRLAEVRSLLRDARKAGIQLDSSSYEALMQSRVLQNDTQGALDLFKEMKEARIPRVGPRDFDVLVKGCAENDKNGLMAKLLREMKEGQKVDYGVHDWNNVIHYFCKKGMMQDAEKALKKMRNLGHAPNAQTFHSLVTGYAGIGGKYEEVTILWGEMKVLASSTGMRFDQELLDAVLYTFVRGGFFVRAMEVMEMMEKGMMFVDKYKYRALFLKYHKTLYKGKAPKFQTEAQLKRREAALAFKKWVGLC